MKGIVVSLLGLAYFSASFVAGVEKIEGLSPFAENRASESWQFVFTPFFLGFCCLAFLMFFVKKTLKENLLQ